MWFQQGANAILPFATGIDSVHCYDDAQFCFSPFNEHRLSGLEDRDTLDRQLTLFRVQRGSCTALLPRVGAKDQQEKAFAGCGRLVAAFDSGSTLRREFGISVPV